MTRNLLYQGFGFIDSCLNFFRKLHQQLSTTRAKYLRQGGMAR